MGTVELLHSLWNKKTCGSVERTGFRRGPAVYLFLGDGPSVVSTVKRRLHEADKRPSALLRSLELSTDSPALARLAYGHFSPP